MAHVYKFYMLAVDKNGNTLAGETVKDLEKDFAGLKYCKAEGINAIGKARVYTEEYVDSDELRVYIPEEITNEATEITLTLYFVGESRYATYDAFNEYIRIGFHKYYDSARNQEFIFFIEDEIKIKDELWYGSTPYLTVEYNLKNINGKTKKHTT